MMMTPSVISPLAERLGLGCGVLAQGRWLVAVSGGGDSVALLRLLCEAGFQKRLVVGNFNHCWGPFGDESAWFVGSLAAELGLECRLGHGEGGKAESNAEARAREARYGWFKAVCRDEGLDGVIVAHTRDDVAELFLMRAGKGSGLQGLAGMKPDGELDGVRVVRPLLGIGRLELRGYLARLGQGWLEDPDNEAGGSQRARIRKLLPLLDEVGIPAEGLAASVAALAEANQSVDAMVEEVCGGQLTGDSFGTMTMEQNVLRRVGVEVAVRVLARLMAAAGMRGMAPRRSKRVALWLRIIEEPKGAATLGGIKFEWAGGMLAARKEKADGE